MSMTKQEKKKIRLKISQLLNNPTQENLEEVRRLGELLEEKKPEKTTDEPIKEKRIPKVRKEKRNTPPLVVDANDYIQLRRQKVSMEDIAEKYNLTKEDLVRQVQRLRKRGLIKHGDTLNPNYNREKLSKEKYLEYKKLGKYDSWIGKEHRIGATALNTLKKEWGVNIREQRSYLSREELIQYFEQGLTVSEIAIVIGKERSSVYGAMKQAKISKVQISQLRFKFLSKLRKAGGFQ